MFRSTRVALGVLLAVSTVAVTASAQAAESDRAHTWVHGSGGGELDFEGVEGDPVTFAIRGYTTEADSPLSVEGTFDVTHTRPDGSPFAELSGSLDCMWVAGDVAVATGVIDEYDIPGMPGLEPDGLRVGFTIDDHGRHDRIGWSWATAGFDQDVPLCTSTAPFFELEHGQFRVHD